MTIESDINEEEMKAIKELRQRFDVEEEPELLNDDYCLRKFLLARDFNIENAEIMLRKHIEWRKTHDVNNLFNKHKELEVVRKYFPYSLVGYDKDGEPVRFCPIGKLDLSGTAASMKNGDITKDVTYKIECDVAELKKQSKKLKRHVGKVNYIADFGNISFTQISNKKVISFFVQMLKVFIQNYPEMLKACYVINASYYFTFVLSLMKTILPPSIMDKIHVYYDDSYKEDLLKVIDADTLPAFLGGNKTDPDGNPLCSTFISHGGEKVPESYYINKNRQPLSKKPGTKKVTLSRAAFHEVELDVKEPGSYLEWEFETKCKDIGFGVFYQQIVDGEEKITELIPIVRIDTEENPEAGLFRCEDAGTYVIVFDNTYSWIRNKEIYYRAKVVTPKEREIEEKENY